MRLLIVDDEIISLRMLEKIIDWEAIGINIVGKATDGKSALDLINRELPDIIITDIKMPKCDGIELIEKINEIYGVNTIKVIIISAYDEFKYAQKAIDQGVVGYLLKPLDEEKLLKIIKKIKVLTGEINKNNKREDEIIERAKNYISNNYCNKNLSLDDICSHVCISKNYFCNLYKKETGESIWQYITKYRINKALYLMKSTNLKSCEICYKVGYDNPSYFLKKFKEVKGITPKEFKKYEVINK